MSKRLLEIDAAFNLGMGILLSVFPRRLVRLLGIPSAEDVFYPRVLGGVLTGIGVALLGERYLASPRLRGLGLTGAVSINLSGATALAVALLRGTVKAPLHGVLLLWSLTATLIGLSGLELLALREHGSEGND